MRHSDIGLTMNVYTDPRLLDVAGAMDSLPELPLAGESPDDKQTLRATGTDDSTSRKLTPTLAPNYGHGCELESITDKSDDVGDPSHRTKTPENKQFPEVFQGRGDWI